MAVVPVKRLHHAKSRLALPAEVRADLALAFALDVVTTALTCSAVDEVVVVTSARRVVHATGALPLYRVPDPHPASLLAAVASGCGWTRRRWPDATTVVVPADLPALRPDDLCQVLEAAVPHRAAFVPDARGGGTTLLVRSADARVVASYGQASAAQHEVAGCVRLDAAPPAARQDVDTVDDLALVSALRLGARTRAAVDRWQCAAAGLQPRVALV